MSFWDDFRRRFFARRVSGVKLMTEQGNRYLCWDGNVYESDIVRAALRPYVQAAGKLSPRHIIETLDSDGHKVIKPGDLVSLRLLLENPNPLMTMQVFLEKMAAHRKLNNNAFAVIIRDENGSPTAIYPLAPSTVNALYRDSELYLEFTLPNNRQFTFPYSDIIHLRGDFYSNDVFGTPLAPALAPLMEVVTTTDQGIVHAIRNGGVIRWLLKFNNAMRPEDLSTQAKNFASSFMDTSSSTGVAAVDSKADATQVSPQDYVPNASQMDRTTQRIQSLLNTNQRIVDNSCSEDERTGYWDAETEPLAVQLNGEFSKKLFSARKRAYGNRIVFESRFWDGVSLSTKLNFREMVDRGALTPNEWRAGLMMAPLPGGDEPIRRLDTAPTLETNGGTGE